MLIKGTTWPGNDAGTQLVGSYGLPSGTTVWIMWREIDMPKLPTLQGTPKFARGASLDDLKQAGRVRMLLLGIAPDGLGAIYDCVAEYKQNTGPNTTSSPGSAAEGGPTR